MTNQRGHETAAKQVWGAVVGAQGLRSVSTQLCVPTYSWASGRALAERAEMGPSRLPLGVGRLV